MLFVHGAKLRRKRWVPKGFSLNWRGFSLLVLIEAPGVVVLTQLQTVGTECFNLQPDVVERPETKAVLHQRRVFWNVLDGVTLYEEAVAHMLEVTIQFILVEVLDPYDGA